MGTYGGYTGSIYVPEEKKELFTEQVFQILNYGGMMQTDRISMYGREITLTRPVEADEEGVACFYYNYFEDNTWDPACYRTGPAFFSSRKIGGREFRDVVTAVYFLYEFYDEGIGCTMIDGEPVDGSRYAGWLNHILGTDFSLKKRFRLWEQFEAYCLEKLKWDGAELWGGILWGEGKASYRDIVREEKEGLCGDMVRNEETQKHSGIAKGNDSGEACSSIEKDKYGREEHSDIAKDKYNGEEHSDIAKDKCSGDGCGNKRKDEAFVQFEVARLVPKDSWWALGGTAFSDICFIKNGTASLEEEELVQGSYPEAVYQCRTLLKQYLCGSGEEEGRRLQEVWNLVQKDRKARTQAQSELYEIGRMSLQLPARILVYLACEITERSFWREWRELRDHAYTDEIMLQFAADDLIEERAAVIKQPVAPVRTADFFRQGGTFAFREDSEGLKWKPDYELSDDDRVFWWDGSEEVVLTEEMQVWLWGLAARHRKLVTRVRESGNPEDFLKKLIFVLEDIEQTYIRVYAFHSMFCEFIQNGKDKRYIAAVSLLEQLAEENREGGKRIWRGKDSGESAGGSANTGRRAMKRYLGVMANRKLRRKYFEF